MSRTLQAQADVDTEELASSDEDALLDTHTALACPCSLTTGALQAVLDQTRSVAAQQCVLLRTVQAQADQDTEELSSSDEDALLDTHTVLAPHSALLLMQT